MIFAQVGLTAKLLGGGLYAAVALMVMVTTLVAPPILARLLEARPPDGLHGESDYVMDSPLDSK